MMDKPKRLSYTDGLKFKFLEQISCSTVLPVTVWRPRYIWAQDN